MKLKNSGNIGEEEWRPTTAEGEGKHRTKNDGATQSSLGKRLERENRYSKGAKTSRRI